MNALNDNQDRVQRQALLLLLFIVSLVLATVAYRQVSKPAWRFVLAAYFVAGTWFWLLENCRAAVRQWYRTRNEGWKGFAQRENWAVLQAALVPLMIASFHPLIAAPPVPGFISWICNYSWVGVVTLAFLLNPPLGSRFRQGGTLQNPTTREPDTRLKY